MTLNISFENWDTEAEELFGLDKYQSPREGEGQGEKVGGVHVVEDHQAEKLCLDCTAL